VQVLSGTAPRDGVWVRWPGGKQVTANLPSGAKEVVVRWDGTLDVVR
jgi:hypothetical protein